MKRKLIMPCLLMVLMGCNDDFLEIPAEDALPAEQFFVTQEHALEAVNQMYTFQRDWLSAGFPYTGPLQITSDDSDKGSSPGDAAFLNDFNNFTFNESAFLFDNYWSGQFRGVNFANQVIDNVPGINMDESLKSRLLAEARFFRGYHYFNLVRAFGGVPIYDGLPEGAPEEGDYNLPRSTVEEVYNFLIADLMAAAEDLPVSYGDADIGRATQGAAKGFLAKVHMYLGNWTQVLSYTEEVKGLGYDLFPDYYQFFRPANEYNIESIFEIQSNAEPGCRATSPYGTHQGVRGQFGWGFNSPSEDLVNAYEPGDVRMDATILFVGETTPEGDLITAGNNDAHPRRYNQKVYIPENQFRRNNCNPNADANIKILRFADILLMNAEANNELGNTAAALESLNRIRNRAELDDMNITDQTELRMAIWRERRVELALEGDRFLDLVRQGRAGEVLRARDENVRFIDGVHELFPIPSNQIELSRGVLEQNPGY